MATSNNYRPANKANGEWNEYIKGSDGMITAIITKDKKGREICRWEEDPDKDKSKPNKSN
jgi:hypothetical protein